MVGDKMVLKYGDLVKWFVVKMVGASSKYIEYISFRTKAEAKYWVNSYRKECMIDNVIHSHFISVEQHSGFVQDVINYNPRIGDKLVTILCFEQRSEVVLESKYLTLVDSPSA
jgi:hypothetical protein